MNLPQSKLLGMGRKVCLFCKALLIAQVIPIASTGRIVGRAPESSNNNRVYGVIL
jgi:hypothetical protein